MVLDKNHIPIVMPNSNHNFQEYFMPLGGEQFDATTDERIAEGAKNIVGKVAFSEIIYYYNKKGNKNWKLSILPSVPYDSGEIQKNYSKRKKQGFTQTKKDWQSIEAYFYVNVVGTTKAVENQVYIGCGGGKGGKSCSNFQYRFEVGWSGRYRFAKVQTEGNIVYCNPDTQKVGSAGSVGWGTSGGFAGPIGSIKGKFVGIKFLCFIKEISGVICRVLRGYIDKDNNNVWKQVAEYIDRGGWGSKMKACKADVDDEIATWGGPIVTFGGDNLKDGENGVQYKLVTVREVDPLASFIDPAPGQGGPPTPKPLPPSGALYRDFGMSWNISATSDLCGVPAVPPLFTFYHVSQGGSHSNLRDIRTRCTTKAVNANSTLVGHKPKRVSWFLRKQNTPTGEISCTLRRGADDTVAVTYDIKTVGGVTKLPPLDASDLKTSDQECVFENLKADYTIVAGDRVCVEYSGGSEANQVEVSRQTDDPFDGPNTCSCKFDAGGIPPTAYSQDDITDDYAGDMSE